MSKRRTHSPEFKARVAIEAISGRMTIQGITKDGAERLIQVSQWIGKLLDGACEFPLRRRSPTPLRQLCNRLLAEAPAWLLDQMPQKAAPPQPSPLLQALEAPQPAKGAPVPFREFISKPAKDLIVTCGREGSCNEDGLRLSLELIAVETWPKLPSWGPG